MKMRIVGLGLHKIIFQEKKGSEWEQKTLRSDLFDEYMINNFPTYYEEYMEDETELFASEFFYHYGETHEMIRNGEAYIFIAE